MNSPPSGQVREMKLSNISRVRDVVPRKNRHQAPDDVRLPVEFESSFESVIQSFLRVTPANKVSPTLANSSNSLSEYLPVPLAGRQLLWPTGKIVPESFHERDLFGCRHLFDGNLRSHRAFSKYQWTAPVILPRAFELTGPGVDVNERSERATSFRLQFSDWLFAVNPPSHMCYL
jgi:hypothetical protein